MGIWQREQEAAQDTCYSTEPGFRSQLHSYSRLLLPCTLEVTDSSQTLRAFGVGAGSESDDEISLPFFPSKYAKRYNQSSFRQKKRKPFSSQRLLMLLLFSPIGTSIVPFQKKRLTHMSGWMALIPNANHINWYFKDVDHISNISYTSTFYGFKVNNEYKNQFSITITVYYSSILYCHFYSQPIVRLQMPWSHKAIY